MIGPNSNVAKIGLFRSLQADYIRALECRVTIFPLWYTRRTENQCSRPPLYRKVRTESSDTFSRESDSRKDEKISLWHKTQELQSLFLRSALLRCCNTRAEHRMRDQTSLGHKSHAREKLRLERRMASIFHENVVLIVSGSNLLAEIHLYMMNTTYGNPGSQSSNHLSSFRPNGIELRAASRCGLMGNRPGSDSSSPSHRQCVKNTQPLSDYPSYPLITRNGDDVKHAPVGW